MLEIALALVVLIGQSAAFVYLINRILLDHDAGSFRSFALYVGAPALLLALPVVALGVFYLDGTLSRVVRLQAPPAVLAGAGLYVLIVAAASARWLWVSLVVLPHRARPVSLVAHRRSLRPYRPEGAGEGNPGSPPERMRSIRRWNCRFDLEVNEYVLRPAGLPGAFNGFSIVQITDLHADHVSSDDWLDHVADRACGLKPDLITLTGDCIDHATDLPRVERFVRRLTAPDGIWAIRGNHDYWAAPGAAASLFERCGIGLLDNRAVEIRRGADAIQLIGIEAPWDHSDDWKRLFPVPRGRVAVVLSHTPDMGPALAGSGAALMLTGHHHGGQIRFPLVGSLIIPSRYGKRYDAGLFALGSLAMYVNRGVGNSRPAIRILCRPEIARFVFTTEAMKAAG